MTIVQWLRRATTTAAKLAVGCWLWVALVMAWGVLMALCERIGVDPGALVVLWLPAGLIVLAFVLSGLSVVMERRATRK
jgi:hypothetical protein